MTTFFKPDPALDLILEREIDVPRKLAWEARTTPEHIEHGFAPKAWTIAACEVDLRPGGMFSSTLRSPEEQEFPNVGCYLEIIPPARLVWTYALLPGYRPSQKPYFTAALLLEATKSGGAKYTALAIHRDEDGRKHHEAMGFQGGWGTVLTQLVDYIQQTMRH